MMKKKRANRANTEFVTMFHQALTRARDLGFAVTYCNGVLAIIRPQDRSTYRAYIGDGTSNKVSKKDSIKNIKKIIEAMEAIHFWIREVK